MNQAQLKAAFNMAIVITTGSVLMTLIVAICIYKCVAAYAPHTEVKQVRRFESRETIPNIHIPVVQPVLFHNTNDNYNHRMYSSPENERLQQEDGQASIEKETCGDKGLWLGLGMVAILLFVILFISATFDWESQDNGYG